jgi:putative tricarboxylic transport membrane protein
MIAAMTGSMFLRHQKRHAGRFDCWPARRVLVAAAFFFGAVTAAPAQTYPDRPIRLVIGLAAGGIGDITMRIVADKLGERLGQRIVIDNRPGAGGIPAAQAVINAAPDGYTLATLFNGTAISVSLFNAMPFDVVKDFSPISSVALFDLLLLTKASSPIRSVADLVAEAKARGGGLNIGTVNPGTTQHLSAELFKATTGIEATIVPFRSSSEVLTALLRDDVTIAFETYAALKGAIDIGQIRPIASSGPTRSLPDVPTVRESGVPTFEVTAWNGIFAPAKTPQAIIDLLNRHIVEVVAMPDVRKRILELGTEPRSSTPAELGARLHGDIAKWAAVIEQAHIEKK